MIEESQPLSGSTMAFETRYDVNTHVLSSVPADRLPAIWGKATLAMLVSSTSMNVASVTVSAMIHGLTAGRQASASFIVMGAVDIKSASSYEPRATSCEQAIRYETIPCCSSLQTPSSCSCISL